MAINEKCNAGLLPSLDGRGNETPFTGEELISLRNSINICGLTEENYAEVFEALFGGDVDKAALYYQKLKTKSSDGDKMIVEFVTRAGKILGNSDDYMNYPQQLEDKEKVRKIFLKYLERYIGVN